MTENLYCVLIAEVKYMLVKRYLEEDVVTMAKKRIVSLFESGVDVSLSFSGGKDSIVLADIVYKLILRGKINPENSLWSL